MCLNSIEKQIVFLKKTKLYQELMAEKEEILKFKWLESQRIGYDIGYDRAFFHWEMKYYRGWKQERDRTN